MPRYLIAYTIPGLIKKVEQVSADNDDYIKLFDDDYKSRGLLTAISDDRPFEGCNIRGVRSVPVSNYLEEM